MSRRIARQRRVALGRIQDTQLPRELQQIYDARWRKTDMLEPQIAVTFHHTTVHGPRSGLPLQPAQGRIDRRAYSLHIQPQFAAAPANA